MRKSLIHKMTKVAGLAAVLFLLAGMVSETFAQQYYAFSTKYRRLGNKVGIEVWVKSLTASAPKLGSFTYPVSYNSNFLQPAALTYNAAQTDSVSLNVDQTNPVATINSGYSSTNGYNAIMVSNGVGYAELEITYAGGAGLQPATTGRGTFVGKIEFDIINYATLTNTEMASILTRTSGIPSVAVADIDGNILTASNYTITDASDITIKGISILNPNGGETVNRSYTYASLAVNGYPVYFERSGLLDVGSYNYGSEALAYNVSYSIDGTSFTNTFRFAETSSQATVVNYTNLFDGELETTTGALPGYSVTKGDGSSLPLNWKGIVRVIWKGDPFFSLRSEKGKLKFTQLSTSGIGSPVSGRSLGTVTGVSDFSFVLSRLFFAQLNGTNEYFRTAQNYSLPTQLTVEAWVNLNAFGEDGTEPGIIAHGGGASSPQEGAFLLYLENGKYPAFRVREFQDRGYDGSSIYLGKVVANEALTVANSDISLSNDAASEIHRQNWVLLTGVVKNDTVQLYVNGQRVGQTVNKRAVDTRMATFEHPLWIGVNPTNGPSEGSFIKAGIKEVKVWRTALTADEILRHAAGVYDPEGNTYPLGALDTFDSLRISLDMYYKMQANRNDAATVVAYQDGNNVLNYYINDVVANDNVTFRPDRPHIKVISPLGGDGAANKKGDLFTIRWVGYGLGSTEPGSQDLQIEYSRDGGTNWADALDNTVSPAGLPLDQVEIEGISATWEPYNSVTYSGAYSDLQGIGNTIDQNYSKEVLVRVSGKTSNNQNDIYSISGPMTVAPYFAAKNDGTSKIFVPGSTDLNLSRGVNFIEMWISPDRFPSTTEGYFPLIIKTDGTETNYALKLLPNGQLQFDVYDANGTVHTALSDINKTIPVPNVQVLGKVWTHVGVLVNLANGTGTSNIRFYIDGLPQYSDAITTQLGANINPNLTNEYPLYVCSQPTGTNYVGEFREFRFWNGYPADNQIDGVESQANPTSLTKFIQGALTSHARDFLSTYTKNLVAAFAFDGGSFVNNGWYKSFASTNSSINALVVGDVSLASGVNYQTSKPYIKLVEPIVKQTVPNSTTNLRVRWVGFDYDALAFRAGSNALNQNSDLSFGILGGGGQFIENYQYVASDKYNALYTNSMQLPVTDVYTFAGVSTTPQYAAILNVSIADPDANNDEVYNDQGPLSASLTNARLRLRGRATINASIPWEYTSINTLETEGPLFTVTPPSNFTVRALLEGFHQGANNPITNTGSTFDALGVKISLFSTVAGLPNVKVDSAEGTGYITSNASSLDPTTRGIDGSYFASMPFVFTTLANGQYFVLVEHLNHLPVLSRFPATFNFDGDNLETWAIESGWDFQSWGQNATPSASDYMVQSTDNIYSGNGLFSAYGEHQLSPSVTGFDQTSLNFSAGQVVSSSNKMAALVAGDVYRDGQINAVDRVLVRADIGSGVYRSDVTGDGYVNAIDRDLVDRNSNKLTRLTDLGVVSYSAIPGIMSYVSKENPIEAISPLDPIRSEEMNAAAKEFLANGGKHKDKKNNTYNLQGGVSYKVMGNAERKDDKIYVSLYIQNTGGDWAPGNCTFGITYETNKLEFVELIGTDENPFNNYSNKGYSAAFSGPTKDANNPFTNLRTIEIDYDGYTRPEGVIVPTNWTKLGTLVYKIQNIADKYEFNWHPITAVLTTDGQNITSKGQFLPIAPIDIVRTVTLTSPNGGENWRSAKTYQITWTLPSDNALGTLEFSIDGGISWNQITTDPINLMSGTYTWKTPKINSNKCLVRIIDNRNGNEIDKSDAMFSINEDAIRISRPASTDPIYKYGTKDYIQWVMEDFATVKFEFSANGVDNWIPVTGAVNSKLFQEKWEVPSVNTKQAVVRMVDASTGEVNAYSTPFKVLGGSLQFINPKKGDVFTAKTSQPVRWTFEYINEFDLQLSLDGGNTWQFINKKVNALKGVYSWVIPNTNSDHAIIRAIWNGQEDMEYARTGEFRITGSTAVEEQPVIAGNYLLNTPTPNPFNEEARISFTLTNPTKVTLKVFNAAGETIATLVDGVEFNAGTHSVTLNGQNLPAGVYLVRLIAGTSVDTQEVIHIK